MSAFFVGTDHINAILTFVNSSIRDSMPSPDGGHVATANRNALTEIGRELLSENIKSLQARYPSDWQEMVDLDVNTYTFQSDARFLIKTGSALAITAIKLCHCLDYQACEHDGWRDSFACRFLDFVISAATHRLPGYEAAPWGYDRAA